MGALGTGRTVIETKRCAKEEGQDEMGEWQPIETAPKDGTHILGWAKRFACPRAIYWQPCGDRNYPHPEGGFWLSVIGKKHSGLATHWMPLPEPPLMSEAKRA